MEKSRLGISVGLVAAILYFMGLINVLGLVILAGYVLICENSVWLKKAAVKAVLLYAAFAMISVVMGIVGDIFGLINVPISWITNLFHGTFRLGWPFSLDRVINYILSIVKAILFLGMGFMSLKGKEVPFGPLDKAIEKHMA